MCFSAARSALIWGNYRNEEVTQRSPQRSKIAPKSLGCGELQWLCGWNKQPKAEWAFASAGLGDKDISTILFPDVHDVMASQ